MVFGRLAMGGALANCRRGSSSALKLLSVVAVMASVFCCSAALSDDNGGSAVEGGQTAVDGPKGGEESQETSSSEKAWASDKSYDSPALDAQEQKRILEAARQALVARTRDLHASVAASSSDLDTNQLLDKEAASRLVGIYENMRPRDAAAVFNVMDPHVLVAISAAMNTRKLSAIMANMSVDRVNMVSQYLVGVRRFHQQGAAGQSSLVVKFPDGSVVVPGKGFTASPSSTTTKNTPLLPSRQ